MWKTLSSKEIFTHSRLTLLEDEVMIDNQSTIQYLKYKDNGGCCVTIIAIGDDGAFLLQTEYSYPINEVLIQFPGGYVPNTETPEYGAARELQEEMGFSAKKLELLGSYLMDNRRSTMKMYVFLATGLIKGESHPDLEENIAAKWMKESDIINAIGRNQIINIHTLASWSLYMSKRNYEN